MYRLPNLIGIFSFKGAAALDTQELLQSPVFEREDLPGIDLQALDSLDVSGVKTQDGSGEVPSHKQCQVPFVSIYFH